MRQGDAKMRQVTDRREPDHLFGQGWEIFYTLAEARVLIASCCRYPQMPTRLVRRRWGATEPQEVG